MNKEEFFNRVKEGKYNGMKVKDFLSETKSCSDIAKQFLQILGKGKIINDYISSSAFNQKEAEDFFKILQ